MKKKIKEVIVVEGKDDISAVKNAVDAEVFQVNGHAVRKNRSIEFLKLAYENKGLIILTDPDYAGEEIRKYLCKNRQFRKYRFNWWLWKHFCRGKRSK